MARRYSLLCGLLVLVGVMGLMNLAPLGLLDQTPVLGGVHVVAGVATGVAAWRGLGAMRQWGQILGFLFVALAVAGFALDDQLLAPYLVLSVPNAWFHLALALVFLYHALLAPPTL